MMEVPDGLDMVSNLSLKSFQKRRPILSLLLF